VKADKNSSSPTYKEVTMAKRVLFLAIIVAAILVVAAPAMAFNGYREDFTLTATCAGCHDTGGMGPAVYGQWAETKHAEANADGQSKRLPYGSSCAGCHTSNYDPSKVIPTPVATTTLKPAATAATPTPTPTATAITWEAANGLPANVTTGDAASSEGDVGCSSCHSSQTAAHSSKGTPNLASAEICGQCHSRYSYTVDTYAVASVPAVKIGADGKAIPNPSPTTLLQPQYAIGLKTMGDATNGWTPQALSEKLNVPSPGWSPTPDPKATAAAGLALYWKLDGVDTPWIATGHDGSAAQYIDWSGGADLHSHALEQLKAVMGPNPPADCLRCHSTDYAIAPDGAKPTGEQAKYGVTCVGCHTPHEKGTAQGIWNKDFTPQLRTDSQKALCVTCHTAELGANGVAKAGTTVHHAMKEMINGTGAIDVPQGSPSVHKGKCVQCHMPPTTLSRGEKQLGANHTFKIITPAVASGVTPVTSGALTTTMPFSACTTCHSRPGDDAAMWLQDTITDRQEAMHSWNDQVTTALTSAAKRLGFKSTAAANTAINKIKPSKWSKGQKAFQKSFTNQTYVVSEGSWGLHNWEYARTVILKALEQAQSVRR
jgi:hypothetical protein